MKNLPTALLSLGLFLGLGMGDEDIFTRPSIWAEPSSLIPVKTNVTLWCRGPVGTKRYRLIKLGIIQPHSWPIAQAMFPFFPVTKENAGSYCCEYQNQSHWSQCSHPQDLVVTGIYEKPVLLALTNSLVGTGEKVILQCQAKFNFDRYALYKEGEASTSMSFEWRSQANFMIPAVTTAHGGTYRCYSFSSDFPYHWSAPSDPLKLNVTESISRPELQDELSGQSLLGLSRFWEGMLTGVLLVLIVFFFLFVLFLCHHQHLTRHHIKSRDIEGKVILKSSSQARGRQEQTLSMAVKDSRQRRPKDSAAEDFQEVTYTQLMHWN